MNVAEDVRAGDEGQVVRWSGKLLDFYARFTTAAFDASFQKKIFKCWLISAAAADFPDPQVK